MIIIEQSKKKSREMGGAYCMLCCYDYVDLGIKFQDEMMIPHTILGLGANKISFLFEKFKI